MITFVTVQRPGFSIYVEIRESTGPLTIFSVAGPGVLNVLLNLAKINACRFNLVFA